MSKRQQVVHVSTLHRSTDNRIFHKECAILAEQGYEVTFVVNHPHDETIDGIKIRALPSVESGFQKLTSSAVHALRIIRQFSTEAPLHFHDPELLPIAIIAKVRGFKVIYDAHEDTPRQVFHLHWIPRWMKPLVAVWSFALEKVAGMLFNGIVTANETIYSRFPARKTIIVRNYPRIDQSWTPRDDYMQRPPKIIYVGGLTEARGLYEMTRAIGIVNQEQPAQLILGGSFHPRLLEHAISQLPECRYVQYAGWLSQEEVKAQLKKCRIGLVILKPERQYLHASPTKLFEYAAAGLPIVASDLPPSRAFISENRCGLIVEPTPKEIALAITFLLDNPREAKEMGLRGREAVVKKYNWSSEGAELVRFYSSLLGETSEEQTAFPDSGS